MGPSRFICRDEEERAWILDMHRRIEPAMIRSMVPVLGLMALCLPWFQPVAFVPMALAAAAFYAGSRLVARQRRLDPLVYAWWFGTTMIALATAINSIPYGGTTAAGAYVIGCTLLIWPLLGACGAAPERLTALATAWCCLLLVVPSIVFFPEAVAEIPAMLLVPVAMFVALPIVSSAVRRASMEHRTAAVVDQLTGMLNRSALAARANELAHQSALTGERVGVIALDLDHFKLVNDTHGHAVGDRVLQEVAYRVRTGLRAFDLAYRVGGEEFVVLLPGATDEDAERIAGELWSAIRCAPVSGLPITASVGVAVSPPGERFTFDTTFRQADAALYDAKAQGRDRVAVATAPLRLAA
jgi:diguanylate cyclase (GGDEF)-like protein